VKRAFARRDPAYGDDRDPAVFRAVSSDDEARVDEAGLEVCLGVVLRGGVRLGLDFRGDTILGSLESLMDVAGRCWTLRVTVPWCEINSWRARR